MSDDVRNDTKNGDGRQRESRRAGPRTPQGKERAKFNAVKTGIFAKVVLTAEPFKESRNDFEKLLANLRESIRPRDHFEQILVESLTLQFLRLARVYQTDATVAPQLFRNVREKFESNGDDNLIAGIGDEEPLRAAKFPAADLLIRYEASIWRQIDRIVDRIQQWRRLRNARVGGSNVASEG